VVGPEIDQKSPEVGFSALTTEQHLFSLSEFDPVVVQGKKKYNTLAEHVFTGCFCYILDGRLTGAVHAGC